MNIYEKLQTVRSELQFMKLKKSGKNDFAKFEYFELTDFLPAVNDLFNSHKLCSRFLMNKEDATLEIINAEKPDETILFSMPVAELELKGCNKLQALGGINTYLRRYLYMNALEIVEADLFDAEAGKDIKQKPQAVKQEAKEPDADFDIITQVKSINDIENLRIYYYENIEHVKDEKAFNVAINKRKKELENGK